MSEYCHEDDLFYSSGIPRNSQNLILSFTSPLCNLWAVKWSVKTEYDVLT